MGGLRRVSNWPIVPGARFETLGLSGAEAQQVTGAANSTAKSNYQTIGTTGFAWDGFFLQAGNQFAGRSRLDIAVNTGGSDQIIVPDLVSDNSGITSWMWGVDIPVAVPAGATVKARHQSSTSNANTRVAITGYKHNFLGARSFSRLVSLTSFSATDPPTITLNGTTPVGWTEITASAPAPIAALYVSPSGVGDNSRTAARFLIEIGVGGAGSEVVVASLLMGGFSAGMGGNPRGPFPVAIPAGVRVAWRVTTIAGVTDTFGIGVLGAVA